MSGDQTGNSIHVFLKICVVRIGTQAKKQDYDLRARTCRSETTPTGGRHEREQARAGSVNSIDIIHYYEMNSEMLQLQKWKFWVQIRILKIANPTSGLRDLRQPQLSRYRVLFAWPQTHRTRLFASHSLRRLAATLQRCNDKTRKRNDLHTNFFTLRHTLP